jgi:hypothetical protein
MGRIQYSALDFEVLTNNPHGPMVALAQRRLVPIVKVTLNERTVRQSALQPISRYPELPDDRVALRRKGRPEDGIVIRNIHDDDLAQVKPPKFAI